MSFFFSHSIDMELFQPTIGRILMSVFLTTILVPFINTSTVSCFAGQCGAGATLFVTPFQTWYLFHSKAGFGLFFMPSSHINYVVVIIGFIFYYLVSCA